MIRHPLLQWFYRFDRDLADNAPQSLDAIEHPFRMEAGVINCPGTLDGDGVHADLTFNQFYANPVVVVLINTRNGSQPVIAQAQNVTPTGCEVIMLEPDREGHSAEDIAYIVVERGVWRLPNGAILEANTFWNDTHHSPTQSIPFNNDRLEFGWPNFSARPTVIATLQTCDAGAFSNPVVSDVTATEFAFTQSKSGNTSLPTGRNQVGYIALENGFVTSLVDTEGSSVLVEAGHGEDGSSDGVEETPHSIFYAHTYPSPPSVVAQKMSDGGDGAWATPRDTPEATKFDVYAMEDQVGDAEQGHANVLFGWFIFERPFTYKAAAQDWSIAPGKISNALKLGINSTFVAGPPRDTSVPLGSVSVFCWCNAAPRTFNVDNPNYSSIEGGFAGYDRNQYWAFGFNRGGLTDATISFSFNELNVGTTDVYAPVQLDGNWHHYAATLNTATGICTIYRDGEVVHTQSVMTPGGVIGDNNAVNRVASLCCTTESASTDESETYDPFEPDTQIQHLGYAEGVALPQSDIKRIMIGLSPLTI